MIYASGFSDPEGPVLLADGSWLLTEMGSERGCVSRFTPEGGIVPVARTGRPNGLASRGDGTVWIAESLYPALMRMNLDAKAEVILQQVGGEPFLWPNDLCFGPEGELYMTDSGILIGDLISGGQVRPDYRDAPIDGRVYRIDPETSQAEKIDSGLKFPNGIAFGPDGNLYVTETLTGAIYRYRQVKSRFALREQIANVIDPKGPQGLVGPDGVAFGTDGKLYVAIYGQGQVCIVSPEGSILQRIPTAGIRPSNVAFGPKGEKKIYVTEGELGNLECFEASSDGLPLFD
jgi:gluconolactonase